VELIKRLVSIAKEENIFRLKWGPMVHPSEILDANAPRESHTALGGMALIVFFLE